MWMLGCSDFRPLFLFCPHTLYQDQHSLTYTSLGPCGSLVASACTKQHYRLHTSLAILPTYLTCSQSLMVIDHVALAGAPHLHLHLHITICIYMNRFALSSTSTHPVHCSPNYPIHSFPLDVHCFTKQLLSIFVLELALNPLESLITLLLLSITYLYYCPTYKLAKC